MGRFPFFPLLNDGSALVQPVYAVDVGKAIMNIVYVSKGQHPTWIRLSQT